MYIAPDKLATVEGLIFKNTCTTQIGLRRRGGKGTKLGEKESVWTWEELGERRQM